MGISGVLRRIVRKNRNPRRELKPGPGLSEKANEIIYRAEAGEILREKLLDFLNEAGLPGHEKQVVVSRLKCLLD